MGGQYGRRDQHHHQGHGTAQSDPTSPGAWIGSGESHFGDSSVYALPAQGGDSSDNRRECRMLGRCVGPSELLVIRGFLSSVGRRRRRCAASDAQLPLPAGTQAQPGRTQTHVRADGGAGAEAGTGASTVMEARQHHQWHSAPAPLYAARAGPGCLDSSDARRPQTSTFVLLGQCTERTHVAVMQRMGPRAMPPRRRARGAAVWGLPARLRCSR